MHKHLIVLILSFIQIAAIPPSSLFADVPKKKIGVLLWSEEARYQEALQGFLHQLPVAGSPLAEIDIIIKRSIGNRVVAMRMADELLQEDPDLYFAIGTGAMSAFWDVIKEKPVVFGMVYDPIGAGFVKSLVSSGNNVTGVTTYVPMNSILLLLSKITPVRRLAVFYTPGEVNSELQLKDWQSLGVPGQLDIVPVPLGVEDNASDIVGLLKGKVQGIFLTGSSVVGKRVEEIVKTAGTASIVTLSHLSDYVQRGVALGVGIDFYKNGRLAADDAVMILQGASPSDIPVKNVEPLFIINERSFKDMGLDIPDELRSAMTRTVE